MKKILLSIITVTFFSSAFVSCTKKDETPTTTPVAGANDDAKHKEKYSAVVAIFNSGNMEDLGKYIDSNYVDHTPDPGQKPGLAGLVEGMTMFRAGFPDFKMEMLDVAVEGDKMAGHIRITGTCANDMMGPGMKGKKIDITGMDFIKFNKEGKCVERWGYWQEKKMMQQLGMLPSDEEMMKDHPPAKK